MNPLRLLQAGTLLDGRYELLAPWAQGGMAKVWLARVQGKHGFAKLFAVKTMLPELAKEPGFRNMFLDEARIAAQIRHVNVAAIEDLGEHEDILYMVFEWIQGDTWHRLANAIREAGHAVPMNVMLRLGAQAAAGLHAAHELRDETGALLHVVHRDVSPQNILVTESGVAKVIDFGIAKAKGRLAESTKTGLVKGKLEYIAREQVVTKGRIDRRTDTFALGAVLYHVLTGRVAYEGANDAQVLRKIGAGEAAPRATNVSPQIVAVLGMAIDPDPARRFQNALDLERALEACITAPTSADDAGRCMAAYLADRSAARRAKIRAALEQAAIRNGEDPPPPSDGAEPMRRKFPTIPPEAGGAGPFAPAAIDALEEPSRTLAPEVASPKWVWPLVLITTLALLAVWGRVMMLAYETRHGASVM